LVRVESSSQVSTETPAGEVHAGSSLVAASDRDEEDASDGTPSGILVLSLAPLFLTPLPSPF
tara:strand:- start:1306 stop:1491 length:186 start_codon:yes stop_codon:yes gene_type:complete